MGKIYLTVIFEFSLEKCCGSENVVTGPTVSASPRNLLLLMLLSRFSSVQLCATPEMAAHQAPKSLGFSRQEYWSGMPSPSPRNLLEMQIIRPDPRPTEPETLGGAQ